MDGRAASEARARERRTALRIMAGFGDGYVGTSTDAAVGQALLKNREKMFATSEAEKAKLREETAAYRLKGESDKFASTSNATEVLLTEATVGLVTKEEFARRKAALEQPAVAAEPAAEPAAASKKKKKKKEGGSLSFAFDDEEGEDAAPVLKKPKPAVERPAAPPPAEAPAAASSSSAPAAAAAPAITPLPAGHTCIKSMGAGDGAFLEINCESRPSQAFPRSRVSGISAQCVSFEIKAGANEENTTMCGFLRALLGGPAVSVEVVRGHKAPIKTLKVVGVASADVAYHRLNRAKDFK